MDATRKGDATEASATRGFTPARIVALALIAAAVAGLAYLRFGPESEPVSVPAGAQAGDLILEHCNYDTEDGSYAADCGTLLVPENRHQADSRLIALPVTRIRARSAEPGVPIFRLQGGPGVTNMNFALASRFADKHDVVLVGYRGVDGSSKLDCPEVTSAREHAHGFLTAKSFRADAEAYQDCARRLHEDGVDLGGYTLPQRVDDLDAARRALGYQRIDLLSESAGTRTAMIYAWRYPKRIHRSVMIGVNPPGDFLWDAKRADRPLRRALRQRCVVPKPYAGPRGLDPVVVRPHSEQLVVPSGQGGERQARCVFRPDPLDHRRRRPAGGAVDDRDAPRRRQGRRKRRVAPVADDPDDLPARAGLGRCRSGGQER